MPELSNVRPTRPVVQGGIEAGGTKFVCAVGTGPDDLRARVVIPTTTPAETLGRVRDFFLAQQQAGLRIEALGIASFGPLDLSPASPTYGRITTTPKPGWAGADLAGPLSRALAVPVALETDVNGAAYGEYRWGATQGLDSSAYLTVGTGIGGGVVVAGEPLRGLLHPEMGHLHVQRHPRDDFAGSCPFHGDCLEGLASGSAVRARTGLAAEDLQGRDRAAVLELEAWYLAQLVSTVMYLLSAQRIAIGGGVLQMPELLPLLRVSVVERLAGALDSPVVADGLTSYLVPPGLGSSAGVLGAIALAERAGSAWQPS